MKPLAPLPIVVLDVSECEAGEVDEELDEVLDEDESEGDDDIRDVLKNDAEFVLILLLFIRFVDMFDTRGVEGKFFFDDE